MRGLPQVSDPLRIFERDVLSVKELFPCCINIGGRCSDVLDLIRAQWVVVELLRSRVIKKII